MSYRIRGQVSVNVEDYHYNGDVEVASDVEGISELMSENNITTMELVDYQNDCTDDTYTARPTKEDVIAYTDSLDFSEIIEILDSYLGKIQLPVPARTDVYRSYGEGSTQAQDP